ncbi:hypothetical protein HMPREF2600_06220 [Neisseria sp. HMSC077D05]|jgi:hypothetical protein|nr:hypothetical protein HMPREF2600_06220 [Neisseria sp. HMSC077D05]
MNLPEYINKKMARWPFFVGVEKLAYYNRFPLKRKALIYRGFFRRPHRMDTPGSIKPSLKIVDKNGRLKITY